MVRVHVTCSHCDNSIIASDSSNLHLKFFININTTEYIFIDERLADQVCERLQITCVKLNQPKPVEGYDGQVAPKSITHVIYPTLNVESLKDALSKAPILAHFDPNKKTILETNTSQYITDNVLSQYSDDDSFHSVIFYNKNILPAECNYHIYNKKLLTIIKYLKN